MATKTAPNHLSLTMTEAHRLERLIDEAMAAAKRAKLKVTGLYVVRRPCGALNLGVEAEGDARTLNIDLDEPPGR